MLTWSKTIPVASFCAALLAVLFAVTGGVDGFHVDFYKNRAEAAAARAALSTLRAKGRKLTQGANDTVCYLGCLEPPVNDPSAAPMPNLLLHTETPMKLLDCYNAAVKADFPYFAVAHVHYCYGSVVDVEAWAYNDNCTLDCMLGPNSTNTCTTPDAFAFSMGPCLRLDVPCAPDIGPQEPQWPRMPAPPRPPSPPPPPPPSPSPPPSPPPLPPNPLMPPAPPPHVIDAPMDAPLPPMEETHESPPPSPPPSSPPSPPPPPAFECRSNTSLAGVDIRILKLDRKSSTADNIATCRNYCVTTPDCTGFFYKTTLFCFLMKDVVDYKRYNTSIIACRYP
ncbi:hypothetical protein Vretimale_1156 [Volvox reticuliferus]|uniref:Apple domain-containing protein n=1 Tax=Volvox reticuliferus TaxID=1737510 RepID=A0A8J4D4U9_9CHLO|nr:hypothetical protein Vretifemale_10337 [Volvox reticuliferus]GIL95053.1 hypothetical protein Vretimale_1156 [Volvox reticuliferus]